MRSSPRPTDLVMLSSTIVRGAPWLAQPSAGARTLLPYITLRHTLATIATYGTTVPTVFQYRRYGTVGTVVLTYGTVPTVGTYGTYGTVGSKVHSRECGSLLSALS